MTVENGNVIDFATFNPEQDRVFLVMVEAREWGEAGALLPELQEKNNTYFSYATAGQLAADYPKLAGKPVQIELRSMHSPGECELEFFRIVEKNYLEPAGIQFGWVLIGRENLGRPN